MNLPEWITGCEHAGRCSDHVVVGCPFGLHARVALTFVKAVLASQCDVRLTNGDQSADGRSILEILLLAARPGDRLEVSVEGPNALESLPTLMQILSDTEQFPLNVAV